MEKYADKVVMGKTIHPKVIRALGDKINHDKVDDFVERMLTGKSGGVTTNIRDRNDFTCPYTAKRAKIFKI